MIDGVSDDVHERIGQFFDHDLIELGILTKDQQLDFFVRFTGKFFDNPAEFCVNVADRNQSRFDHVSLQIVQFFFKI